MTPQQRNDYSFLPPHPTPMSPEEVQRRMDGWNIDPEAIIWLPAFRPDWRHWLAVAAIAFFACMGGYVARGEINKGSLAESFNAGLKIGAICQVDPTLAACSRESMRSGGVL